MDSICTMTTFFYFLISRSKLLLVLGFVFYGLFSSLSPALGFFLIWDGHRTVLPGGEAFFIFSVLTFALMGGRMEPVTEFIQYTGFIVGFVGAVGVWTLPALFIHNILSWLDEDKHVFERFKRK